MRQSWRSAAPRPAVTYAVTAAPRDARGAPSWIVEGAALSWVIQLRWIAAAVQLAIAVLAVPLLDLRLPLVPLLAIAGITAATNAGFVLGGVHRGPRARRWLIVGQLIDVGLLTALLYFAGGPANPAVALYVVHVAIAAMVLGSRWAWAMVAVSTAGYAALLYDHVPLPPPSPTLLQLGYTASTPSTVGTWLAYVTVAAMVTYFIARIRAALHERDAELARARSLIAKQERLAALTTLAAGAAHELSTPLSTIAVAAAELDRALETPGAMDTDAVRADARLIRDEVHRCRDVLDRMSGRASKVTEPAGLPLSATVLQDALAAALPKRGGGAVHVEVRDLAPPGEGEEGAGEAIPRALVAGLAPIVENALLARRRKPVVVCVTRLAESLRVDVTDDGPGMDAATLARVGEPFFSTRGPGAGMGLGVFLARLIAERLGGRLDVVSSDRSGTAVAIEVPRGCAEFVAETPAEGVGA